MESTYDGRLFAENLWVEAVGIKPSYVHSGWVAPVT